VEVSIICLFCSVLFLTVSLLGFQDACESIGVLPTIKVYIEELNRDEFNVIRGISVITKDAELFETRGGRASLGGGSAKKAPPGSAGKARKKASQEGYFRLKVKDNGCGMNHDKIPDLLGRVLSGSKYGVRQTRGKFGLGE
jgi:DNA topoisomerase-6 subunit B